MVSIPKCSRARARARLANADLSDGISPAISLRMTAQSDADGTHSHPVRTVGGSSMTLSVGPPLLHPSTESPDDMASTGMMPKCSFAGVYSSASVDDAVSRAARWVVVRKGMSGSLVVMLKGGMGVFDEGGEAML